MDEHKTQALYREALDCIDAFNFKRALQLGRKLLKRRYSGAFEVLARAHIGLDELDQAIGVLEQGVAKAPGVYVLWQQLGCYYSDAGRYDDALAAFDRARPLRIDGPAWVDLNRAIALNRADRNDDALAVLDCIRPPASADECGPQDVVVSEVRSRVLNGLGRFADAIATSTAAIERLQAAPGAPEVDEGYGTERINGEMLLSWLYGHRGEARWRGGGDQDAALKDAWRAVELDRTSSSAAWLIRKIENSISPAARYFRIMVAGVAPHPERPAESLNFLTTYDVVADNTNEALAFIRRFEPAETAKSLRIEECEDLEPRPNEPKGVYDVTGRIYSLPESAD